MSAYNSLPRGTIRVAKMGTLPLSKCSQILTRASLTMLACIASPKWPCVSAYVQVREWVRECVCVRGCARACGMCK